MVPGIITLSSPIRTFPSLFSFRCHFLFLVLLSDQWSTLQALSSSSSAPALKASAVTTLANTLLLVVFNIFHTSHLTDPYTLHYCHLWLLWFARSASCVMHLNSHHTSDTATPRHPMFHSAFSIFTLPSSHCPFPYGVSSGIAIRSRRLMN